jgi:hypothetical protein
MKDQDDDPIPESTGKASGFTTSFSVHKDKTTGQVLGWDEFFRFIDEKDIRTMRNDID